MGNCNNVITSCNSSVQLLASATLKPCLKSAKTIIYCRSVLWTSMTMSWYMFFTTTGTTLVLSHHGYTLIGQSGFWEHHTWRKVTSATQVLWHVLPDVRYTLTSSTPWPQPWLASICHLLLQADPRHLQSHPQWDSTYHLQRSQVWTIPP